MPDRLPAVAGTFYEGSPSRLRAQVAGCFAGNEPATAKQPFIGAVVPHAGLMYSGHVAAAVYDRLALPQRMIILSPNHTGLGRSVAINREGAWITPLGAVPVDEELATELIRACPLVEEDALAHAREHSLEVQLPFLQTLDPSLRFVPLCLKTPRFEWCVRVGEAIAGVVASRAARGEKVGLLASSDMNHYEDQETTLGKDQKAIDCILALDAEALWNTVLGQDISMCGIIPATTMLVAARRLGATRAELVKHATSGDINGDYSAVVGYAGIIVS